MFLILLNIKSKIVLKFCIINKTVKEKSPKFYQPFSSHHLIHTYAHCASALSESQKNFFERKQENFVSLQYYWLVYGSNQCMYKYNVHTSRRAVSSMLAGQLVLGYNSSWSSCSGRSQKQEIKSCFLKNNLFKLEISYLFIEISFLLILSNSSKKVI